MRQEVTTKLKINIVETMRFVFYNGFEAFGNSIGSEESFVHSVEYLTFS